MSWSPDALRLRAAYDDLMTARQDECVVEAIEYESERSEFDGAHPSLPANTDAARQSRAHLTTDALSAPPAQPKAIRPLIDDSATA